MEFVKPTIENTEEIRELMKSNEYRCSDFCAGTLILWGKYYGYVYTVINDFFVIRMTDYKAFSFPKYVGKEKLSLDELETRRKEVLGEMMDYFRAEGEKPLFCLMSSDECELLEKNYPGLFEFDDKEDYRDYIYNSADLATFAGRHYHGKRNHIHRFEEEYPDYKVERISEENKELCKKLAESWTDEWDEDRLYEKDVIFYTFDHMEELHQEGYAIIIPDTEDESGNKAVAFAVGERLTDDCFVVHFEKAAQDYREAYTLITRELAKAVEDRFMYINKEEDLGLEGLRQSKKSYRPTMMCEKMIAMNYQRP